MNPIEQMIEAVRAHLQDLLGPVHAHHAVHLAQVHFQSNSGKHLSHLQDLLGPVHTHEAVHLARVHHLQLRRVPQLVVRLAPLKLLPVADKSTEQRCSATGGGAALALAVHRAPLKPAPCKGKHAGCTCVPACPPPAFDLVKPRTPSTSSVDLAVPTCAARHKAGQSDTRLASSPGVQVLPLAATVIKNKSGQPETPTGCTSAPACRCGGPPASGAPSRRPRPASRSCRHRSSSCLQGGGGVARQVNSLDCYCGVRQREGPCGWKGTVRMVCRRPWWHAFVHTGKRCSRVHSRRTRQLAPHNELLQESLHRRLHRSDWEVERVIGKIRE